MGLFEEDAAEDPIEQFGLWRQDAVDAGERQPDAVSLATATTDGRPSVRFVMLRGVDNRGFVFYTNYTSRKALELEDNGAASLAIYWPLCERQVRVEGVVQRLPSEQSDAYFQTRPREARLETWASPQSRVIDGREWLERRWRERDSRFREGVPRPEWWGGYRLHPSAIEFWQQGEHRMHDRLLYRRLDDGSWKRERLAP